MAMTGEETHLALGKMRNVDAVTDGGTDMLIAIPFGFLPRGKNDNIFVKKHTLQW